MLGNICSLIWSLINQLSGANQPLKALGTSAEERPASEKKKAQAVFNAVARHLVQPYRHDIPTKLQICRL